MASGSLTRVARVAEVTRGTTPATPVFQILRDSRRTGGLTRDLIRDPAVRPDRNLVDARLGPKKVAFSLPFTLAYGAYDTEMEALLGGTWTAAHTMTATTISAAASDNSYNDSGSGFVTAGFQVGDKVVVTGFTGSTANNITSGTITALTAGKMTIGGSDGDVIVDDAAGESVTIKTRENILRNGTTRRYFTYEHTFTEFAEADKGYLRFTGSELNTAEWTIANNGAIVEGSFGLIGADQAAPAGTAISGSSYTAASTNPAFGSFDGTITEGGVLSAVVTEFKISIANGIESQYVIGSPASNDSTIGDFEVTGSVGLQFRNSAMLEKALAETTSSLVVPLTDLLGNVLTVTLPKIKFGIGTPDVSQKGLVPLTLPFTAMYDSTAACTMSLTRIPV